MKKLTKPELNAKDVFSRCISRIRDEDLKNRLTSCSNTVEIAANEFDQKAPAVELHTIQSSDNVDNTVTSDEMKSVYTQRMVKKTSPGREYYDFLMAIPDHGRCPLCGQRIVTTLDHHLPKAHYPALVVSPLNLIPACKDCNTIKNDDIPASAEDETIHPYYDDIENDTWLKAQVVEDNPVSVKFFVTDENDFDELLNHRIKKHFKVFHLESLYASYAADEIINIRYSLNKLYEAGGVEKVQEHLTDEADSREHANLNSWQTALYKSLASSIWFCENGFR